MSPFDDAAIEYDEWFTRHPDLFESELLALKQALPAGGHGIEIGVGTGRFAKSLGIKTGIDPAPRMAEVARARGINVAVAPAEKIPSPNESFDYAMLVTVDCFLNQLEPALSEIWRILKPGGSIVIGMIDRLSRLGKTYLQKQTSNKFYADAKFHSPDELTAHLRDAEFEEAEYWQSLIHPDSGQVEQPERGYGKGGFVVIRARKPLRLLKRQT